MKLKLALLNRNREVMLAQKAIEILPNIMSNFAQGYSTIGKMTIVGGSGNETNVATRMAGENAKAMSANFEIVKSATGVDLQSMLKFKLTRKGSGRRTQSWKRRRCSS